MSAVCAERVNSFSFTTSASLAASFSETRISVPRERSSFFSIPSITFAYAASSRESSLFSASAIVSARISCFVSRMAFFACICAPEISFAAAFSASACAFLSNTSSSLFTFSCAAFRTASASFCPLARDAFATSSASAMILSMIILPSFIGVTPPFPFY